MQHGLDREGLDDEIRAKLMEHSKAATLWKLAESIGIAGGTAELRKILNSTGELHIMDRGMLAIHLGLIENVGQ